MGSVTKTRVSMTWREDGSVSLGARWDAAAWRAVERREMNMEPTLSSRPVRGELGKGERERDVRTADDNSEKRETEVSGGCSSWRSSPLCRYH